MGAQVVGITEQRGLDDALTADAGPIVLVASAPLDPWIAVAVAAVRAAGRGLCLTVADAPDAGEARAGREIGLVTALIEAGVAPEEIDGVDRQRVARVAEVVARWHDGGADS